ncbi:MAG: HU family DNA-binding protein [bacterium]|nr:HU family DNA-binding protein [bacterium]
MTKVDLVNKVAEIGLTKNQAGEAVDAVVRAIKDTLSSGGKVQLIGFGSFEVRERAARQGRNPQTGDAISIAAKNVPVFKPGTALREAVNA